MKYTYLEYDLLNILSSNISAIEHNISNLLYTKCENYPEDKDELKIIANFMSMHLDEEDISIPYKQLNIAETERSFTLEDVDAKIANTIFENIEKNIDNNIILSRIFDILWVTKKLGKNNVIAGEKACKYYIDYLQWLFEIKEYVKAGKIVKRYIALGLSLPKSSTEYKKIFDYFEKWIQYTLTSENEYFLLAIYEIYCTKISLGEKNEKISEIVLCNAEKYIDDNISSNKDILLQRYVYIIAKIARKTKQSNRHDNIWLKFSKYYYEKSKTDKNLHRQIDFLKKSNECLRRIPGSLYKDLLDSNQIQIDELQSKIPENMHIIKSTPIDITKEVINSKQMISNLNIGDALLILAKQMNWIPEEYVKEHSLASTIEKISNCVTYTHNGQPKNTSSFSFSEQRFIDSYYQLFVAAIIQPMLDVLNEEHFITKSLLQDVTKTNPFIPNGYETIYAIGLYYFLTKNYLEAANILVPAFENSLRYLVSKKHPTTYFKDNNTELNKIKIKDFIKILENDKIISPNIAFNLVYFFGDDDWNIRNELAHGLISYDYMYSHHIIVALLAIYWFVLFPYLYEDNE